MSLARRLASQSTIIFGGRLFGAGLIFLVQAFIAQVWGAAILGDYLVVIAAVNLIAVTMPLGFQTIGTYFAAEYRARNDRRQLIAFVIRAYSHVGLTFLVLMLAGPFVLGWLGLGQHVVAVHYTPVALLALATALVYVNGAVLVGLKRPFAGFFADGIFRPLMVLGTVLASAAILNAPTEAFGAMLWGTAFGYVLIALVHMGFVIVTLPRVGETAETRGADAPRWWRFAAPWVLITLATDFFFDIDLLLLANLLDREELAIFGVCTRIFALVSFGVAAVYAVILPDMFESEANADRAAFHRKVGEANLAASVVSLVLFGLVIVGAPFALLLFGPAFTAGALPLAILCLGLVVRSVMGPASMVLSIHDRPWASLPAVLLGMGTLFAGNLVLVPTFHLVGAALAAIIAISVWSVALWLIALRTAQIDVSILQWFKARRVVAAE
ncbi:O-antigen/teichoic acid export membrane protein [Devosia subaequoris]|uniref:O-antigen/teichoic acid export membrane protein n=1 Tax=Devosia subaequoris TaxID=395930 RepID=A0A7W6IM27_9HYPH|nr:polysaccharide biosynthesis C-terminal domain-containing protein [Devosia subaequoris]MBB4051546.1 O-antigen/teichoic acid export membrane protein [Devosia subaequoris]MCP1209139.1 polysaccharide biosynthesis C-terminal domain-containing protein [Devosia subaequoris]